MDTLKQQINKYSQKTTAQNLQHNDGSICGYFIVVSGVMQ
jgi:hypothetical protein